VTNAPVARALASGDKVWVDGELATIVAVISQGTEGADLVIESSKRGLQKTLIAPGRMAEALALQNDGTGEPEKGLTSLWGKWMEYATPRIRSAVLAVRPVRPFPHQDEAVHTHMLPQPRLRFLLADEPGTGKTIMTGMYLAEARRRGLIQGKAIIIVPAHLVSKWIRDLHRYFGIEAMRLTADMGRGPQPLRPDIEVWVLSVDLYTYNEDVRRKVAGPHASWSLAVFDEAHRLTPTSQYLSTARQITDAAHHLVLLTATPHRGNEHFFRGLLNLLDQRLYPWQPGDQDYGDKRLQPGRLHFLRRMKEELRDVDGQPLFPHRFAKTQSVALTGVETDAYEAVMSYVDEWYSERSALARSVYGKRAASSLFAVAETLQRRRDSLTTSQVGQVEPLTTDGFADASLTGAVLEDDEAWERAEEVVVQARSRNRKVELQAIDSILASVRPVVQAQSVKATQNPSAKWTVLQHILNIHEINPTDRASQVLVFTEFADTAHWLARQFRQADFTCEVLEGATDTGVRDDMQQRFMNRAFQVLVSTDAGGEGIDLQSANVMIDWDIPWSLVRLEQRMGRLHRIGQTRDVFIYHLVAPATREGRVQERMLENLDAAGHALNGRIFDLLDATAGQLGFNYAQALVAAQQSATASESIVAQVPEAGELISKARELAREEDRLKAPIDFVDARRRFADDRLEAINPVIVEGFLRQLAHTEGWQVQTGLAPGILLLSGPHGLPESLGGGKTASVSADGAAVRHAYESGANVSDVKVLGPTEEVFGALVSHASQDYEEHLVRGVAAQDQSSLSDYVVFVWTCEIESDDGIRAERRPFPFLIRYSGTEAFAMDWEAVLKLSAGETPAQLPSPGARLAAEDVARQRVAGEQARLTAQKRTWVEKAKADLDDIEARYKRQLATYSDDLRPQLRQEFAAHKTERLGQLARIATVTMPGLRLVGWLQVRGAAAVGQMGWDPDSEKAAVATVMNELAAEWAVDDRQTAGVGYDLFARNKRTGEQRLIEVKGLQDELAPVTLEQHEWAQAQQRGADYWLYVVAHCNTTPKVVIRTQDPASIFTDGAREIRRFQIPVAKLRRAMEAKS